MPKTLTHVISDFGPSGINQALTTLIGNGFYAPFDLRVIALRHGDGAMENHFRELAGADRVTHLFNGSRLRTIDILDIAGRLKTALSDNCPDTVILSGRKAEIAGNMAALSFPHVRVARFQHVAMRYRNLSGLLLWGTSPRTDLILGDTSATIEAMQRYTIKGIPSFSVTPVALEAGEPRESENPETIRLLSFGRLAHEKNYENLVQAVAMLRARGHRVELDIFGEGRHRCGIHKLIEKYNLVGFVRLRGYEADDRKKTAVRDEAHIYVQPSIREGFCLAVAEAMSRGMPVVASNVGGMRDYGRHGKNMLKLAGTSAVHIVKTVSNLIENYATLAPHLSQGAIKTTREKFSPAAVKTEWASAQHALLQENRMRISNPGFDRSALGFLRAML